MLRETVQSTTRITATVMFILICAQVFALAFRGLHGEKLVEDVFTLVPGGVNGSIWFMMALIFVLGFFIEWIEISYIVVPLFLPLFIDANTDLVWLATLICVNLQTSFLTPPFGWSLFFLRGVAPPGGDDARHLPRRRALHRPCRCWRWCWSSASPVWRPGCRGRSAGSGAERYFICMPP